MTSPPSSRRALVWVARWRAEVARAREAVTVAGDTPWGRRARLLAIALPVLLVLADTARLYAQATGFPMDGYTYLAAGERLNAGHSLYGPLQPGDRSVIDWVSYGTPLLSPPLVAVVWRPLAALGAWTIDIWWAALALVLLATLVALWARAPLTTAALATVATYPLSMELLLANLNCLLVGGVVVTWLFWRRDRLGLAMAVAVTLAAAKIFPGAIVLWLLAVAPRRTWRPMVAAVALLLLLQVAGAGLAANFDYLGVLRGGGPSPRWPAVVIGLVAGIVLLRSRPSLAFGCAVAAMAVAWVPVLVVALAAPIAWPARTRAGGAFENESGLENGQQEAGASV